MVTRFVIKNFRPRAEAFVAAQPEHPDSKLFRHYLDSDVATREATEDLAENVSSLEARAIVFDLMCELARRLGADSHAILGFLFGEEAFAFLRTIRLGSEQKPLSADPARGDRGLEPGSRSHASAGDGGGKRALAAAEDARQAQEAGGIGLWEFDFASRTMAWSQEQYQLYGRVPEAGPPNFEQWLDYVEPGDRGTIREAETAIQAQGASSLALEFRIRRGSDGALRWLASRGRLVRDDAGRASRIIGVNFDVTERRNAEDQLRRATALLRAVGTSSPDPIYVKDAEGRFLFANPAFLAVIGKTEDEIIGQTDASWHDDPKQAAAIMATDRRIDATGRVEVVEESFDVAGRGRRVFRSAKAPLQADQDDGQVIGVVAVLSDITEMKTAETELRLLTETLEARVRDEVEAREAAQRRAGHAQRMQVLGQLAAGIAHDFNNVLQTVQGTGNLIQLRAADENAVRRYAHIVLQAAERGASVTRRLLTFARQGDLRAESIEASTVLGGMRDLLETTLGAAITILVDARPDLPALLADRGQLENALVNLAVNARDAMPEGGTLTLSAAMEDVAESDANPANLAPGSYIRITVVDTGTGMDAATLTQVFQPFFTTKPPGQGTGLGLAMVQGFVGQSGGGVAIDSTPGEGTAVSIWLPVAVPGERPLHAPPDVRVGNTVTAKPGVTRILVVDDDALVLETLKAQLEAEGFEVAAARSGAQALALLDKGLYVHAIVADLSMPGMDGMALIQEAQARRPGLPAVLLAGYAGDGVSLELARRANGPFSLIRKPIQGSEAADWISALLTHRRAGRTGRTPRRKGSRRESRSDDG